MHGLPERPRPRGWALPGRRRRAQQDGGQRAGVLEGDVVAGVDRHDVEPALARAGRLIGEVRAQDRT